MLDNQKDVTQFSFFYLKGGKSQMKKSDKAMGIWSAILVPAILSGFCMEFEGEVKGVKGYHEA